MDNGKNDLTGMEETWRGKDRVDSREKWQDLQHFCHHHHYHNDDDDEDVAVQREGWSHKGVTQMLVTTFTSASNVATDRYDEDDDDDDDDCLEID